MGDRPVGAGAPGGVGCWPVRRGAARALARAHRHGRQDDEGAHHVRGRLHRRGQGHDVRTPLPHFTFSHGWLTPEINNPSLPIRHRNFNPSLCLSVPIMYLHYEL
jgi:hypothetical protein